MNMETGGRQMSGLSVSSLSPIKVRNMSSNAGQPSNTIFLFFYFFYFYSDNVHTVQLLNLGFTSLVFRSVCYNC